MRKSAPLFLIIALIFIVSSCVVLGKKQYKGIMSQQDSLISALQTSREARDDLERLLSKLKTDTADLKVQLNRVRMQSTGNIQQLMDELSGRDKKLTELERAMNARDQANMALKESLSRALLGFKDSGLSVDIKDGRVYVSLVDKLLFGSGSIVLDQHGREALVELSKVLREQQDLDILVEGHTDNARVINLGQIKDNWDLSVLRATSVVRFLEQQGIAPVRIEAAGKGQYQPLALGDSPDVRSKNRRIEIILSPDLHELYKLIEQK